MWFRLRRWMVDAVFFGWKKINITSLENERNPIRLCCFPLVILCRREFWTRNAFGNWMKQRIKQNLQANIVSLISSYFKKPLLLTSRHLELAAVAYVIRDILWNWIVITKCIRFEMRSYFIIDYEILCHNKYFPHIDHKITLDSHNIWYWWR